MNSRGSRNHFAVLTLLVLLLGVTFGGGLARAQDSTHMVSASLLRVLGEAADGYRTGRPLYIVADYRFPHTILGIFPSAEEARRVAADSFGVFGPIVTPRAAEPDSGYRLVGVTLTYQVGDSTHNVPVDLNAVDALFFTYSAIDKFVIPYYTKLYGPALAQVLESGIRSRTTANTRRVFATSSSPRSRAAISSGSGWDHTAFRICRRCNLIRRPPIILAARPWKDCETIYRGSHNTLTDSMNARS